MGLESSSSATSYRGRHAVVGIFGAGHSSKALSNMCRRTHRSDTEFPMGLDCFPESSIFCSRRCPIPNPNHVARRGEGASWQNHAEGEVGGVRDRTDRLLLKDRMQRMERSAIAWTACFGRTRSMPSAKYVNSACVSIDQVEHYARAGHMRSTSKQCKRSLPIIWSDINELAQQRDEVPSPTTIEAHHNFPGALDHA